MEDRIDNFKLHPFLDGPSEVLVSACVAQLLSLKPWQTIFGKNIDNYRRMDYPFRSLPGMRIYNDHFVKDFESWFITGDLMVDIIFPPSIRRQETQTLQDMLTAAVVQQFRSQDFFQAFNAAPYYVPGLNELGKTVTADKSLGFEYADDVVPMTQVTVNFRIDLRIWDLYLEADNRTREEPFVYSLANLDRIVSTIQALNDDLTDNVEVPLDQEV
jgi:hypothetical protein